jgi:hypothetical protein
METYPIVDVRRSPRPFAFEVENAYVGPGTIARLLVGIDGVTDVRTRKLFGASDDIRVEFKYLNLDYVVWEPYGDSSRYWIGPKNSSEGSVDIVDLEAAFKRYKPPWYRVALGDLLSLRFFKRFVGRG